MPVPAAKANREGAAAVKFIFLLQQLRLSGGPRGWPVWYYGQVCRGRNTGVWQSMGNLLLILGVLFLVLVIAVPLIERFGSGQSDADISKMSRFILPLVALLLVLQAIRYFFF